MRTLRKCTTAQFNSGTSKCQPDFGKMVGAILVPHGTKLPAGLTADKLEELAHADAAERIYGIAKFVEYAKNGGEVQTAANGYGPEEVTGVSARKDTYTLLEYAPELHAALTRNPNKRWDVYFYDENNIIYGLNDGSDTLAGYPMSAVYSDATPHPTSSAKAQMTITFAHEDAKKAIVDFDYEQLTFNPQRLVLGLTPVVLKKTTDAGSAYKLYEAIGGNDVTGIYGPLIADAGSTVISGTATAVTYGEDTDTLTITGTGEVGLKAAKILYANDIKGIVAA